jgi:hypothetical protein
MVLVHDDVDDEISIKMIDIVTITVKVTITMINTIKRTLMSWMTGLLSVIVTVTVT